jgi:hypothetical protein
MPVATEHKEPPSPTSSEESTCSDGGMADNASKMENSKLHSSHSEVDSRSQRTGESCGGRVLTNLVAWGQTKNGREREKKIRNMKNGKKKEKRKKSGTWKTEG